MKPRTSIFADPNKKSSLDLSQFKPNTKKNEQRPPAEEIDRVSEGSRFVSRESTGSTNTLINNSETSIKSRKPRVYRTGRHRVVSVKTTNDHAERFYQLADKLGIKVAETFELAIESLERDNI